MGGGYLCVYVLRKLHNKTNGRRAEAEGFIYAPINTDGSCPALIIFRVRIAFGRTDNNEISIRRRDTRARSRAGDSIIFFATSYYGVGARGTVYMCIRAGKPFRK